MAHQSLDSGWAEEDVVVDKNQDFTAGMGEAGVQFFDLGGDLRSGNPLACGDDLDIQRRVCLLYTSRCV